MPPRADVPGDLLFGLLALQAGLIDQSALVSAFHAWCRDSRRPMAEILVEDGAIDPSEREVVAGLVGAHLKRHGGDREGSLAALDVDASTVEVLARVGDPDLEATIGLVGLRSTRHDEDGAAARPGGRPGRGADATETVDYGGAGAPGPRYRIVRKLGSGGLGVVFVAVDSVLRREVALKQVRPDRDDPQARARFLVEAEVTGGLEHPGIVPVHDQGASDGGRPFYVMRLVRGDTLKDAIAAFHKDAFLRGDSSARALALQKLLRRFLDVCHAVDYAHSRGILHRDIKPSNVVVGKHGETLVIDWGLAKSVGRSAGPSGSDERTLRPASGTDSAETRPGSAFGSLPYMPREQALGDLARVGPRSDVYALGATLYHLLVGRPPFEGRDDLVLAAIKVGDFPRPRAADPTIAPALEAVCLKAMALEPEGRYGSARELAEEVERWLADAPVTAWREPASVRLRRWGRRHRPLVAAAAALLVMATLASIGAALLLDRHNRRLEAEQLLTSAARAEADAYFLKAIDAGDAMLTRVFSERLASVSQMEPLRRDVAIDAANYYDAFLRMRPGDPPTRHTAARVFHLAANVHRQLDRNAEARALYDRAIDLLEGLRKGSPGERRYTLDLAETLVDLGEMIRLKGRPREAEPYARGGADLAHLLIGADPGSQLYRRAESTALFTLGNVLLDMCRRDEARPAFERSSALRRSLADAAQADPRDRLVLILILTNLATAQRQDGLAAEAIRSSDEALRRARDLRDQAPKDNNRRFVLCATLRERALALAADPGRLPEACRTLDEAVGLIEGLPADFAMTPGYRHRQAEILSSRGEVRATSGRHAEADSDRARARALLEGLIKGDPASPEYRETLGLLLGRLAERARERGETAKAVELLASARAELALALEANPEGCAISAAIRRLDDAGSARPGPGAK